MISPGPWTSGVSGSVCLRSLLYLYVGKLCICHTVNRPTSIYAFPVGILYKLDKMLLLCSAVRWSRQLLWSQPSLNNFRLRVSILLGAVRPDNVHNYPEGGALQLELSHAPLNDYEMDSDTSLWDSAVLWAVPKKRTSHSKKRMRMAHKYLKPIHHYRVCSECNNLKLMHVLCGHCLKQTLAKTAAMRREEIEQKLLETRQK